MGERERVENGWREWWKDERIRRVVDVVPPRTFFSGGSLDSGLTLIWEWLRVQAAEAAGSLVNNTYILPLVCKCLSVAFFF